MILQMANFLGTRVAAIKGKPTPACPVGRTATITRCRSPPRASPAITSAARARSDGQRDQGGRGHDRAGAHDSSVTRGLLSEAERQNLEPDNLSLPLGPPSGYVIRFTNGLVAYFTGDTAVHADQKTVVADFHKPTLMVLNLGLSSITMASGAYIANDIIKPATVLITTRTRPRRRAARRGRARAPSS
jgi:hypothetical protein